MRWGLRVLPWVGIVVLAVSITADSPVPHRMTDTVVAATAEPLPEPEPLPQPLPQPLPPVRVRSYVTIDAIAPLFVFPEALDEETRLRLMTPERSAYDGFPNFGVRGWRLDAGGVPSAEAEVDG